MHGSYLRANHSIVIRDLDIHPRKVEMMSAKMVVPSNFEEEKTFSAQN